MRRLLPSVILNEVKDLIAASHRWGNRHEVLRFAQDDKRRARDDREGCL